MSEYPDERVLYDGVTFTRGLGDSGRKISIVEEYCEKCSYDRMILERRVFPESRNDREFHCQNPGCSNYHDGIHIPGNVF